MTNTGQISSLRKGEIYTLAQSETQKYTKNVLNVMIKGEGTNIIENPALENRAKRKTISRKMILSLIDAAKEKGRFENVPLYWNAYHCLNNVTISNNRMHGDYCKTRFCTVCSAIRKAELINKYYPTLLHWKDVHFVTLTIKACKAFELNKFVKRMFKAFERIHNRSKTRFKRGKGIKLIGIKSLECNFNPISKTYNPHFHIIVPSKEIAELLKKEWIKQWKPTGESYRYKYTSPQAQHVRPVKDLERDLIETIKYGSKIFTEPDLKKKSKTKVPSKIYANALDNIFTALRGKRIFDRFGFNLPKQQAKKANVNRVIDFEKWEFPANENDWVNPESGECLTGYMQPPELSHLLNECIDTNLY
jgi:hypothetical protein